MAIFGFIDFDDPEGPVVALFRQLALRVRQRLVRGWPVLQATIQTAYVEEVRDDDSGHMGWRVQLSYDYKVDGIEYGGKAQGPVWTYDPKAAQETAKTLLGANLPVRYKPSKPARSIYLPSDGGPPQLLLAEPDPKTGLVIVSLK